MVETLRALHTVVVEFGNRMRNYSYAQQLLLSASLFLIMGSLALANPEGLKWFYADPQRAESYAANASSPSKRFNCLPKGIRADEVVSYGPKGVESVTVEKKLLEMKARCRRGKLVDARRREIRFFRTSCWGNPPPDYLEIRQREDEELVRLKKRYTVIVFGCNPMIQ